MVVCANWDGKTAKNLQIDEVWGAGSEARIEQSVADLLRSQPDVIFVNGARALAILEQRNNTTPVVMVATNDPRGGGFNESIARPATNVTGFLNFELSLLGKMLAQFVQAAPRMKRVGLLINPQNPNADAYFRGLKSVESEFHIKTLPLRPAHVDEIGPVIESFSHETGGGLLLPPDVFVIANRRLVIASANAHMLPTIGAIRNFAADGGLMSYRVDLPNLYRRAAGYISRVLHGEQARDLPIQTPTKYELVINQRVAKVLGLTIPEKLLALADEVIE